MLKHTLNATIVHEDIVYSVKLRLVFLAHGNKNVSCLNEEKTVGPDSKGSFI